MITTCTDCGALYEAGSEEQAYEKQRWCFRCRIAWICDPFEGGVGIADAALARLERETSAASAAEPPSEKKP